MTKDKLYRRFHEIAKEHKVRLRVYRRDSIIPGRACPRESRIVLSLGTSYSISDSIGVFLHELAHILDYRDDIYRTYYHDHPTNKSISRWAVKAERHADKRGLKLAKQYFPRYKNIKMCYGDTDDREWLLEYYKV
jgi:hypothetical protein